MIAKFSAWAQRSMPTREQLGSNRFVQPFAHRVLASELWRFTRRSVPRGVALGMLVGIIIPFAQIVFAAFLSLSVRANVPVAALTTFITNPFTTPLIWAASYKVGERLLYFDSMLHANPIDSLLQVTDAWHLLIWLTAEGKVLALGLVVVAVVSAAVSYLATSVAWSAWIRAKRRRVLAARDEPGRPSTD
ncbi:DUF2062 domain-containing protein [Novosphingobium piscinae]|uniref:DUF2062 domain-containing protein n=1 Tax=Novosphingobium piscinae TaxID=1507448 RepID=A0A7X1FVW5_9SPHN|nr:DUF2062 domain-containing protein [Novosphingobium piscinae]MBC2667954.1 DUF2062 domain-containing protein [Novosphingobium piscinae]